MDTFLKSGRFFLAAPMLIFPPLHFIYSDFVSEIVPPWIPWHLFWTYFTAITIFAAGVSILIRKYTYLATLLLGIEIMLFVILIHLFLLFHKPGDPWADRPMFGEYPGRVVNAFKDFGLFGAVFLFAGTLSGSFKITGHNPLLTFGRIIVGISITAFGLIHFIYPFFAPGIPPMNRTVSFIVPGESFWRYVTGMILLVLGIGFLIGKERKSLVTGLALFLIFFELIVWVPDFLKNPNDMTGNWLKDLGIIGGVLIYAGSLQKRPAAPALAT
jgi:uncharacterized membrane protein